MILDGLTWGDFRQACFYCVIEALPIAADPRLKPVLNMRQR
jgi:hypothetical protein